MDLATKVATANASHVVPLGSLEVNFLHKILHAERVVTRYGPSVILTIARSTQNMVRVFLPRRYASLFTDGDIEGLNNQRIVSQDLVYRGKCDKTGAYIIDIQPSSST